MASSSIIEVIRRIAETEVRKMHIAELGIVTSVFPHSDDSDKDNYECSIKLKDKEAELRKVPVATQHIGLANILHVGDLVLVSFVNGDINSPIIIGRLYNDEDRPPTSKEEEIIYKPPYSKNTQLKRLNIVLPESTVTINLHDDRLSILVGKSSITANSAGEIVVRSTKNTDSGEGSSITLDENGISIDTDFDIQIHSKGNTTMECDGNLSFKGQTVSGESTQTMNIKSGLTMNIQSSDLMAIKSDALANIEAPTIGMNGAISMESSGTMNIKSGVCNLESTGPTTIKGAIINLNP